MKLFIRLCIILPALILFLPRANSTHVMGAEIEWDSLGGDSFLIKVMVYRDCNGIRPSATPINVTTSCGSVRLYTKLKSLGDVTPICNGQQTRCDSRGSTFKYGIQLYEMSAVFHADSFIKAKCCEATISWQQCCRNSSITSGAANQNFYVEAKMNFCQGFSSPKWSSPAMAVGCLGRGQSLDHGMKDIVAYGYDSVHFEMTSPMQSATSKASWFSPYAYDKPVYFLGFPKSNLNLPRGFHLDASSGEMMFRPMKEEQTVMAVRANLFKNGKLIAHTMRDCQYIVIKCPDNEPPVLSGMDLQKPLPANFSKTVCAGSTACFKVTSNDKDTADSTSLLYNSGIPGASFSITNPGAKREVGQFCWTPDSTKVSALPYRAVISAKDNACPFPGSTARSYYIKVVRPYQLDLKLTGKKLNNCGGYDLLVNDKKGRKLYDVAWYENDSILIGKGDSLRYHFKSTGTRKITARVADCTGQSISQNFTINHINNLNFHLADTALCGHRTLRLAPKVTGAHGPLTYQWNVSSRFRYKGSLTNNSIDLNLSLLTGNQVNPVSFEVVDSLGCRKGRSIEVLSKTYKVVDLEKDRMICEDDASVINLTTFNSSGNWSGTQVSNNVMNLAGLSTGHYLLTYELQGVSSCVIDSASIHFRELPKLILSNDFATCTSNPFDDSLKALPPGGTWTGVGVKNNNIFDPNVGGKGTYKPVYSLTDAYGCTARGSVEITVFDYKPKLTLADTVKSCDNDDEVSLKAKPTGGKWIGPGIASHASQITVDPSTLGKGKYTYTYAYSDSNRCFNADSSVLVVLKAPTVKYLIIDSLEYSGALIRILNQSPVEPNLSYTWEIGNPSFITVTDTQFMKKIDSIGLFDVSLTITNQQNLCASTLVTPNGIRIVKSVGISEPLSEINIYPNPSSGHITLAVDASADYQARVLSIDGRELIGFKANPTNINIKSLSAGVYLLELVSEGKSVRKLIVKK